MKNLQRKSLSILLIFSLLFTLTSLSVFAETEEKHDTNIISDYTIEAEPIDLTNMMTLEMDEATVQAYNENSHEEILEGVEVERNVELPELPDINLYDNVASLLNNDFGLANVTDVIKQENSLYRIYPLYAEAGQAFQVQMEVPKNINLNYDLYLYKFDMATGNLITNPVDLSIYTTTNQFMQEAVGNINTSDVRQAYAIMVHSKVGYSDTETFTLNVSITEPNIADVAETNENAFTAKNLGVDLVPGTSFNLTNVNLNSPYDNDWFVLNVPNTDDISTVNLSSPGLKLETYYATDGTTLVRTSSDSKGNHKIVQGTNYIRVSADETTTFEGKKRDYALQFSATKVDFDRIVYTMKHNGQPWKTQNYSAGGVRYAFNDNAKLEWDISYISKSGYLCKDIVDAPYMKIQNECWTNPHNQERLSYACEAEDGEAFVTLNIMPGFGQLTDLTLYYDYSVWLTMHSDKVGYVANKMPVYITSQIR